MGSYSYQKSRVRIKATVLCVSCNRGSMPCMRHQTRMSLVSRQHLGLNEILFFRCCAAQACTGTVLFCWQIQSFLRCVTRPDMCADMVCERLLFVSILFNRILAISGASLRSWRCHGGRVDCNWNSTVDTSAHTRKRNQMPFDERQPKRIMYKN